MSQQSHEAMERSLFGALEAGDLPAVRDLCTTHTWLIKDHLWTRDDTWLQHVVRIKNLEMLSLLLDLGFNIDAVDRALKSTALTDAISDQQDSMVDLLLRRGANPDLGRALIAAINVSDDQRRLRYLNALLTAGADVNQQFPLYGDKKKLFTALDWAQKIPEVAGILRSHRAKTAAELEAGDR
jgi:ankyrin repeat protein